MIKNDKQLKITKERLSEFEQALAKVNSNEDINPYLKEMQLNAINSDINIFQKEISEYEKLKRGQTSTLPIASFKLCYEALIKARIAKGWTQAELAEKVNLKEQQIQRYESTDYSTASLPRINEIIYALGINISLYVTGLTKPRFILPEGYTEAKLDNMQKRASQKRTLLQQ